MAEQVPWSTSRWRSPAARHRGPPRSVASGRRGRSSTSPPTRRSGGARRTAVRDREGRDGAPHAGGCGGPRAGRHPHQRGRARLDPHGAVRQAASAARPAEESDAIQAQMAALHPLGRVGEVEEVAEVVAHLLSDQAPLRDGHGDPRGRWSLGARAGPPEPVTHDPGAPPGRSYSARHGVVPPPTGPVRPGRRARVQPDAGRGSSRPACRAAADRRGGRHPAGRGGVGHRRRPRPAEPGSSRSPGRPGDPAVLRAAGPAAPALRRPGGRAGAGVPRRHLPPPRDGAGHGPGVLRRGVASPEIARQVDAMDGLGPPARRLDEVYATLAAG